ncbi:ORF6N domain-containing protein [Candidatus Parcubacteria bacterium]|nr:ORF6N domain-containing protein [Candidatus Parcubacteria bacterium]
MEDSVIISSERIVGKIYIIRNRKVMLDRDLAELYGVKTKVLNQAVKRNMKRFPEDFMFQLNKDELKNWRSQIVTSKSEKMGLRQLPLVFTEQGVAMLSSVLNSDRAIHVNVQIIRTFTRIREFLATNEALQRKMMEMEKNYDSKIKKIFDVLEFLLADGKKPSKGIGFK